MSDPGAERVQIVDRDNRPSGAATRREMRRRGLIYRATYILVLNGAGELFLQRRSLAKDMYPGYFDPVAGGVVLEGEDYDASARRELAEELGVGAAELATLFDFYYQDAHNKLWGRAYECRHEGPFVLQASEIDEGFFCAPAEVLQGRYAPVTPDGLQVLGRYLQLRGASQR